MADELSGKRIAVDTLGSNAADAHEHACRLLRRLGLRVARIVLVDADSVLYVDRSGHPRTAWLQAVEREVVIHDEAGFSAQQPVDGVSSTESMSPTGS
jgi:hypothetical protein